MNKKTTIQFNEEVCSLSFDYTLEDYSSKQKHTIVYVGNPFSPEDINYDGITKQPEYSIKGEDLELDKAWKKYNKAEVDMERTIIDRAVETGLIDSEFAKQLKWSRKAGCSCGCSPGWRARDFGRKSVWLTVKSPSKEEEKKKRQEEYASKKEEETLASVVI